ncbi:hypothetical protein HZS_7533 [Henneguya salminicola]|nr:hypothetical protein HZS_7533 [Henneguya salminicola]
MVCCLKQPVMAHEINKNYLGALHIIDNANRYGLENRNITRKNEILELITCPMCKSIYKDSILIISCFHRSTDQ